VFSYTVVEALAPLTEKVTYAIAALDVESARFVGLTEACFELFT
jgi:hypothetical protein